MTEEQQPSPPLCCIFDHFSTIPSLAVKRSLGDSSFAAEKEQKDGNRLPVGAARPSRGWKGATSLLPSARRSEASATPFITLTFFNRIHL